MLFRTTYNRFPNLKTTQILKGPNPHWIHKTHDSFRVSLNFENHTLTTLAMS